MSEAWQDAEYLGVSPGSKLCTTLLDIAKYGEITTTFQFTGTGKLIQFDYAQYCISITHMGHMRIVDLYPLK